MNIEIADESLLTEHTSDVLEIVTIFSARMCGARCHKNKNLIDGVTEAVKDVENA
jgi:predicted site-specific integrase-resolvase